MLGDSGQSEIEGFLLGWAKWVRNQPWSHFQGCFSSASFLELVALWLSGQDQALLHLFVAVDRGNCNLQDRFLPNCPQKSPWGIKNTPTQQAKTCTAPCASPCSTHPAPGQGDWGAQGTGELAWGQGQGPEAQRGGSCAGFSLHCCCSGGMFNCSSTADIICRYECRPRGR